MKVPIRYKSSDRYNAGVDVVYDDESKMQYAPFIYAGTQSGDNGTDDGGEEGEDVMVVNIINNTADATWDEIKAAVDSNKLVMIKETFTDDVVSKTMLFYVTVVSTDVSGYFVTCLGNSFDGGNTPYAFALEASSPDVPMTVYDDGGGDSDSD